MSTKGGQGERQVSAAATDSSTAPILHIDMDAFFASVELLDYPELRGTPVIVGGKSGRAVVTSATYEARKYGVRSAMPVSQAIRLCPKATILEPHHEKYRDYSARVMKIFADITPLVEPLSIDEAFLDVAGARRLLGEPATIAASIRERVLRETGLTCSVGAAASKFVAKLASTRSKPDGLLVIPADATLSFLHPLPVGALWGVGKATVDVLARHALHTIGDIAATPKGVLEKWVGVAAGHKLHDLSWGIDPRVVTPTRLEKSVGHENTFDVDVIDPAVLRRELLRQSERVAVRLRAGGFVARTISLKLRFSDFSTISRAHTIAEATDTGRRIYEEALALLAAQKLNGRAVRLIGVRAEQLSTEGPELSLWSDDDNWRDAEQTMDAASAKFGRGAITSAALLRSPNRQDTPRSRLND